jgi:hypothetical protein
MRQNDENVYADVYYNGCIKPSIDTAIHAKIYEVTRCKAILHIHTNKIFLGYPYIDEQFPCGSMEERDAIVNAMKRGYKYIAEIGHNNVVQMKKHGLIITGESIEDCEKKLNELFLETPYINTEVICKDVEVLDHIDDVRASYTKDSGVLYNLERHDETIGCVWEMKERTKWKNVVNFGIYTKADCRKGMHIVENYLKLYDKKYILYTMADCHIEDFYRKKYGFVDMYRGPRGLILMYRP